MRTPPSTDLQNVQRIVFMMHRITLFPLKAFLDVHSFYHFSEPPVIACTVPQAKFVVNSVQVHCNWNKTFFFRSESCKTFCESHNCSLFWYMNFWKYYHCRWTHFRERNFISVEIGYLRKYKVPDLCSYTLYSIWITSAIEVVYIVFRLIVCESDLRVFHTLINLT